MIIDAVQKVTGIICQNLSSVEVSRHQNVVQRRVEQHVVTRTGPELSVEIYACIQQEITRVEIILYSTSL